MNHSREPWQVQKKDFGHLASDTAVISNGGKLSAFIPYGAWDEENAARIVACINALAGVADPATAIAAARDALKCAVRCTNAAMNDVPCVDYQTEDNAAWVALRIENDAYCHALKLLG